MADLASLLHPMVVEMLKKCSTDESVPEAHRRAYAGVLAGTQPERVPVEVWLAVLDEVEREHLACEAVDRFFTLLRTKGHPR